MSRTIQLNNGQSMPTVGLGTYRAPAGEVERAIKEAIDAGYRHFDGAWIYGNEDEVGRAIRAKIDDGTVTRKDLFISSKLWNNFHKPSLVLPMLSQSLKALNLEYLDLFMMHWPMGFKANARTLPVGEGALAYSDVDYVKTWSAMEDCVRIGLTKSIGLANFNSVQIRRILRFGMMKPVVNEIECNPSMNQKRMIEFCKERGIVVVGYYPLGYASFLTSNTPGFPEPSISDPKIVEIGEKYNKTPAQVVLNYLINQGIAVIPKTLSKLRIVEYINIFDFQLDAEDIQYLDSLNKNSRVSRFEGFADHPFYPFSIDF